MCARARVCCVYHNNKRSSCCLLWCALFGGVLCVCLRRRQSSFSHFLSTHDHTYIAECRASQRRKHSTPRSPPHRVRHKPLRRHTNTTPQITTGAGYLGKAPGELHIRAPPPQRAPPSTDLISSRTRTAAQSTQQHYIHIYTETATSATTEKRLAKSPSRRRHTTHRAGAPRVL